MADASDSKSDVGDDVWVQVASPALFLTLVGLFFVCRRGLGPRCASHIAGSSRRVRDSPRSVLNRRHRRLAPHLLHFF